MDENTKPNGTSDAQKHQEDDAVIDLTLEIGKGDSGSEADAQTDAFDPEASGESDFLSPEDVVDHDIDVGLDPEDDFVNSLGMEIDTDTDDEPEISPSTAVADESGDAALVASMGISIAQVESALERTITKMFYDRIDQILVEVIEKIVTREIERLKHTLLQEASGE